MKKILVSVFLLFITIQSTKAQDVQVLDNPPDWSFMMSNLNTAQFTSGILYNKVAMFSNLYDYSKSKSSLASIFSALANLKTVSMEVFI